MLELKPTAYAFWALLAQLSCNVRESGMLKKLLLVVTIFSAGYGYFHYQYSPTLNDTQYSTAAPATNNAEAIISNAFANHKSDLQVSGQGIVMRLLPDDSRGSRHQRFIIRLASGQTLLVAHNIDLAPRLSSIREGDLIQFNGEYEWNEKGGVLHWTHRDPHGSHATGWLKFDGQTYQ